MLFPRTRCHRPVRPGDPVRRDNGDREAAAYWMPRLRGAWQLLSAWRWNRARPAMRRARKGSFTIRV